MASYNTQKIIASLAKQAVKPQSQKSLVSLIRSIQDQSEMRMPSRVQRTIPKVAPKLNDKRTYLQIAFNTTLSDAARIIDTLPVSDRILIEAGTPLIKQEGMNAIRKLKAYWERRVLLEGGGGEAYIVADLKCIDRAQHEARMAAYAGASAAVVMGSAPIETIQLFIDTCVQEGIDSMVDMMNVDQPYKVLRRLSTLPTVVVLHRGVDEERDGNASLPIHMINKVIGTFNVLISVAGGDTPREVQSAVFNGAHIVVLWKDFYQPGSNAQAMAEHFLSKIKD